MIRDRLLAMRAAPRSEPLRRGLLATATVGLLLAVIWAWRRTGLSIGDLRWWPVWALAAVAAPASLALKAAEFAVASRMVGQHPSVRRSTEVAVVSSAANLLPLPGSLLVTVQTLATEGAGYGRASRAGAVPGLAWLGVTGVVGGATIAVIGPTLFGTAIGVGGLVAFVLAWRLLVSLTDAPRHRVTAAVLGIEAGWLAASALRFTLAAAVLGVDLEPGQAVALSVAGALTTAIGFVPGGLGVREALIAALGPLIGLDVETGLLLGAVDRVVWLGALFVAGGAVGFRRTSPDGTAATD